MLGIVGAAIVFAWLLAWEPFLWYRYVVMILLACMLVCDLIVYAALLVFNVMHGLPVECADVPMSMAYWGIVVPFIEIPMNLLASKSVAAVFLPDNAAGDFGQLQSVYAVFPDWLKCT